jgi:hypothetical protein
MPVSNLVVGCDLSSPDIAALALWLAEIDGKKAFFFPVVQPGAHAAGAPVVAVGELLDESCRWIEMQPQCPVEPGAPYLADLRADAYRQLIDRLGIVAPIVIGLLRFDPVLKT